MVNPSLPPGTRIWSKAVPAAMTAWAQRIVADPKTYPLFSVTPGVFNGVQAFARVEHHTWTWRNGVKITGDFRGVTVYEMIGTAPLGPPMPPGPPGPPRPAPAPTPITTKERAKGVDVSHYQGKPNWVEVALSGITFMITKATEGTSFVDATLAYDWEHAKNAGLLRGAYHFFRPRLNAKMQADFYLQHAGDGELPPSIDLEVIDGVSLSAIVAGVDTWLDVVIARTGRRPLIYTGLAYWLALPLIERTALTKKADLWLARWGSVEPGPVGDWPWTFWQYSAQGHIPGITDNVVDRDLFHGTLEDLHVYLTRVDHPPAIPILPAIPEPPPTVPSLPAAKKETEDAVIVDASAVSSPALPAAPRSLLGKPGVLEVLLASVLGGLAIAVNTVSDHPALTIGIMVGVIAVLVFVILLVRRKSATS